MAFNAGAVQGTLELDVKDFVQALKRAESRLDKVGRESQKTAKGVTTLARAAKVAGAAIAAVGTALVARAGFRVITGQVREAAAAFVEFEQDIRNFSVAASVAGIRNVPQLTESFREFASEVQRATAFSDGLTLSVGATLLNLGVQSDKLEEATTAVLNYSAATGRDANESAKQLGRSLSGLLGELGEQLPQLRGLSQEALKAGEAFDFVNRRFGGFAEQAAQTAGGALTQLQNQFVDLQKTIGEALAPVIVEAGAVASEVLGDLVKLATENAPLIRETFAVFAAGVLDAFAGIAEALATVIEQTLNFRASIAEVLPSIVGAFAELVLQVREFQLAYFEMVQSIPGLGNVLQETVDVATSNVARARAEVDGLAGSFADLRASGERSANAANSLAAGLRKAAASGREVAIAVRNAADATGDLKADAAAVDVSLSAGARTAARLAELQSRTAEETGAAATQASRFRQELEGAAQAAGSAASAVSAAGSAAGGGGGGGGADAFGRRRGGSAGFDTSTAAGTSAALSSVQSALGRTFGGSFSRLQRRSLRATADRLAATLRSQTQEALSAFTSDVVGQLNSQGIFDPVQRQAIIGQRVEEARRLGILPSSGGIDVGGSLGTAFG